MEVFLLQALSRGEKDAVSGVEGGEDPEEIELGDGDNKGVME